MSGNRLMGSLGSLQIENTLALANINFDFSLFKVAAPVEYQPLGAALSDRRRTNAEGGIQHITARKLGALFQHDLPLTPNLFKAYGFRVSEISTDSEVNPRGTSTDGSFASHVGADGTTIWAAATSGQGAIAVHLLVSPESSSNSMELKHISGLYAC